MLREGKERRERKGNIDVRENIEPVAFSYAPCLGTKLATQVYAPAGNQTCDPLVYRRMLQPTETPWPGPNVAFENDFVFL